MYLGVYAATIAACSLLGVYVWGRSGLLMGAGIGFIFSPIVGYIIQITGNKRDLQRKAVEYMDKYPDMVERAFPDSGSLDRLRLVEHTMLSISAIVNKHTEGGGRGGEAAAKAVSQYAEDCAIDEKSEDLGRLVEHMYGFLSGYLENQDA